MQNLIFDKRGKIINFHDINNFVIDFIASIPSHLFQLYEASPDFENYLPDFSSNNSYLRIQYKLIEPLSNLPLNAVDSM